MSLVLMICFIFHGVCVGFVIGYQIARRAYRREFDHQLSELRDRLERNRMDQIVRRVTGERGERGVRGVAGAAPPPQRGVGVDFTGLEIHKMLQTTEKKPEPQPRPKPARHIEVE